MKLEFGYGKGKEIVEVDENNVLGILKPNAMECTKSEEEIVKDALAHPIGTSCLNNIVHKGETVAIVTSDITRPMPTWKVLPAILDELYSAQIRKEDITLVFALGSHRTMSEEEKIHLVGERAYKEIKCVDSDINDCVHFGTTKQGTPVDITRTVAQADRIICLGNIEFHYFAGYSGGAKAIMPGVSTPAAIKMNHRFMVTEDAHAGKLSGNPVREDLEEAVNMVGVDFILNVVLNEKKEIVYAVSGDITKAHRKGCEFLDGFYKKQLDQKADIVIVSQGGAPKDLNLYQTQKALDNAKHAVKDGGIIILVGACNEGLGNKVFERWMTEKESPSQMIHDIKENFELGGHKAAAIAMVLQHARIFLVSEMDPDFVRSIFLEPYSSVEEAYTAAKAVLGENATVLAMPYGGSTLPMTSFE